MKTTKFHSVEEYVSVFTPDVKEMLEELRAAIKQAAPEAEEVISYNMPAFRFHGMLVWYAAHREHIGFYPGGSVVTGVFKDELADYQTSRGTIRFPLDKKLPLDLITRIVLYRVKANLEKAISKTAKKL